MRRGDRLGTATSSARMVVGEVRLHARAHERETDRTRFEAKYRRGPGCWEWLAGKTTDGYGTFYLGGRTVYAHRVSYELSASAIPTGMQIDHLCKNRACVRPDHLEVVTLVENVMRGDGPVAENARKTHCLNGHEYDATNTYITPSGWRACRACKRQAYANKKRSVGTRTGAT